MSHLRDLQKLRENRASIAKPPVNNTKISKADKIIPDLQSFGRNLQRVLKNSPPPQPQQPTSQPFRKGHRKGLSINGFTYYDKRQQQSPSPALSIYNYSVKLPRKDRPVEGPNTARDYRHEEEEQQVTSREPVLDAVNKNMFRLEYVIGKGGFGKVWKVEMKKTGKIYAMKEMFKTKIIDKKSINSVMNERQLLSRLKHPFLVNMSYAFQDRQNLYLVMDFLNGGDLRYHIGKRRRFTQAQTKFFMSCILISLQYLHTNKIIHRDIKPQNLVLQSNGYVRLTDLGISRQIRDDNANDTSGTPGYMAPEVMCRRNHTYAVDFFALGVMGYEFMLGRRPYLGKNRKEIRDQILAKQVMIAREDIPRGWSEEAADFVNRLLARNHHNRLGANGIDEVKQHPWLKSIDWTRLYRKEIRAPFIPLSIEENYEDYKQQISQDTIVENEADNALMLRNRQVQELFEGYYFDYSKKKTKSTNFTTNGSYVNTQQDNLFTDYSRKL